MQARGWTGRLAEWCARRRWTVVFAWVGALVLALAALSVGGVFTSEFEFTNDEESQVAKELLEEARGPEPLFELVVVQSPARTVDDPAFEAFAARLVSDIRALDQHVDFALSYYDFAMPNLVSDDRRTLLVPVKLTGDLDTSSEHVVPLLDLLQGRDGQEGFTVVTGGYASINYGFEVTAERDLAAETRALPVALVILVLVFGALVAALTPLVLAGLAIMLATAAATLLSNAFPLSIFVTNMIVMIGLALGIDYSLFIVERFREERRRGRERLQAIAMAGDTASRAVLFSGVTVVIALLGLLIVPSSLFRALAAGAILSAIGAVLVGLTLLPALLGFLGDGVNRLRVPVIGRRSNDAGRGFWARNARVVMAHPVISVVLSTGVLIALGLPYFTIELGSSFVSSLPPSTVSYRAFRILDEEFTAGRLAPTEIVVQADDVTAPPVAEAVRRLAAAIEADPALDLAPSPTDGASKDKTIWLTSVSLPGEAASDESQEAVRRLRSEIVPAAFEGTGAAVFVGGQAAINRDFFDVIDRYTPVVFAFVLGLSFLLLLVVFRSLIVPLKAIVMNLLSVGAAYGLLVLVFQHGIGAGQLGFQQVDTVEAWVPIFLFTILFGLSMDYHVFLLSRIRERYDQTRDNAGSVAFGLASTANIITGAAAIMIVVFGGFALGDLVMFQQMGFGLAAAVLLDATLVRTVLVPAAMELLGDRNWYLPSWLAWLPDLRVDGPALTEQPVRAGEATAAGD